ncbi:hypothetical protein K438DRAFT_1759544 [Mycena galopus ATCC 62051]|nr:hypothetical protein K438DRAFT_1759544 [Mycena galopus ATCC 62051]
MSWYFVLRVTTPCEFGKQREAQLGLPPGQSHRPVLAKPTCGPDKSDTLARLRRHAGGVREEFTADKGDVRVSSGADKGDVRVGSSADKGDVQMSRIKRDGVPLGGAKRGVGWARDGRRMGAGWARGGPLRDACSTSLATWARFGRNATVPSFRRVATASAAESRRAKA